jgi:hypothetical protein
MEEKKVVVAKNAITVEEIKKAVKKAFEEPFDDNGERFAVLSRDVINNILSENVNLKKEIERLKVSHKFIVTKGGRDYGKTAHFKIIDYDRLKEQNAELQKQVDELTKPLYDEDLFNLGYAKAVKDTAKEIISWLADMDKRGMTRPFNMILTQLKERYGVEVE